MVRLLFGEAQNKAKKVNRLRSMEDLLGLSTSNSCYSGQKFVDTEIETGRSDGPALYEDENLVSFYEPCKTPRRRGRPRKNRSPFDSRFTKPDYDSTFSMSTMELHLDSDIDESVEFGTKMEKADLVEDSFGPSLVQSKHSACDEPVEPKNPFYFHVGVEEDTAETTEDDEWTLQMWQQKYLRKSKKRNGLNKSEAKHNKEQADSGVEHKGKNSEPIFTVSDVVSDAMPSDTALELKNVNLPSSKVDVAAKDFEENFDYCSEVIDDLESGGLLVADIEKYDDSAYLSFASPTVRLELEDESENGMSNLCVDEDEEEVTCGNSLSTPASLENVVSEKKCFTSESKTSVTLVDEKVVEKEQRCRVSEDDSLHEVRKQICFSESRTTEDNVPEQSKDVYEFSPMEVFGMDEDSPPKPTRIPCKRKTISPSSQEMLLKASRLGDFPDNEDTIKPKQLRVTYGDVTVNRDLVPRSSAAKHILKTCSVLQPQARSPGNDESILVRSSPPSQTSRSADVRIGSSPSGSSPSIPRKGILRSAHSTCRGLCHCEGCVSVRSRAAKASDFSQRQMQDIEGLAVKLMKDLSMLRGIVEDKLLYKTSRSANLSIDQLKAVTSNALETEETAKRWLIRMARDCNRYCKIMRFQERKLTFADEAGGQLCHIKLFHSKPMQETSSLLDSDPVDLSNAAAPQEEMLVAAP